MVGQFSWPKRSGPGRGGGSTPQHAEPTGTAAPFRRSFGNGFKTALDAVSLLATDSKVDHECFDVTLKAEQINSLQGAIVEGRANFKEIEMMVKTRGDLQCVRTLALSLTHDADSHQPSIKAALANLATDRPNPSVFLNGLMTFLQGQENPVVRKTMNNPKMRLDAQAQNDFISEQLQAHIDKLGAHEANKILEQLIVSPMVFFNTFARLPLSSSFLMCPLAVPNAEPSDAATAPPISSAIASFAMRYPPAGSIREPPDDVHPRHRRDLDRRETQLLRQPFGQPLLGPRVKVRRLAPSENSRPAGGCSPSGSGLRGPSHRPQRARRTGSVRVARHHHW